jgi:hypothetical protein
VVVIRLLIFFVRASEVILRTIGEKSRWIVESKPSMMQATNGLKDVFSLISRKVYIHDIDNDIYFDI